MSYRARSTTWLSDPKVTCAFLILELAWSPEPHRYIPDLLRFYVYPSCFHYFPIYHFSYNCFRTQLLFRDILKHLSCSSWHGGYTGISCQESPPLGALVSNSQVFTGTVVSSKSRRLVKHRLDTCCVAGTVSKLAAKKRYIQGLMLPSTRQG